MSEIFLSYSHADVETVELFARHLEEEGFSVWWDATLRMGEAFDERIEAALRGAKAVIVLWSRNSVKSRWVRAEATLADRQGSLMPVMIETCERPIMFELTHTSDLSHWSGDRTDRAWRSFASELSHKISGTSPQRAPSTQLPTRHTSVAGKSSRSLMSRNSVGILPIQNMGGDETEFLADDIGHDLVSMLSNAPNLKVAAYDPGLKGKSAQSELRDIATTLGVHYLVSGALSRRGDMLRLRIGLIDAEDNRHILSWRLEEQIDRFHDDLEEFILDLSTPILSEIQIAGAEVSHVDGSDRDASQIVQTTEMLRALYSERRAKEIVDHLEDLLQIEPENVSAHAGLTIQLAQNLLSGWAADPAATLAKAREHLAIARSIAPGDPDVLLAAGTLPFMLGDHNEAVRFLRQAVQRNPNNPHALALLGASSVFASEGGSGIEMIRTAERRAPHHPRMAIWATYRGVAHMRRGEWKEARDAWRDANDRNPNYALANVIEGVLWHMDGRPDEGVAALKRAPGFTFEAYQKILDSSRWIWANDDDLEKYTQHARELFALVER
ncbi:TIR domain-containing protein [Qipengyuania sp. RANM35]|uniref:TIR domain-containing protein n=1 Tax=Qipengyuania sp. RANM35 TaxID=3068635 RepID=UPI0034DB2C7B